MNSRKLHLLSAARKALFQRAQLERTITGARINITPDALKQRAKRRISEKFDTSTAAAEAGLRKYSLPLGLVAGVGLLFAFRRPLGQAVDAVMDMLERQNADTAEDAPDFHHPDQPQTEHDDEPV